MMMIITLLIPPTRRARTCLSTHDTTPHTIWNIRTWLVRHMSRKVHQVIEIGYTGIFILFHITLKLGWDWWLDGDASSFRCPARDQIETVGQYIMSMIHSTITIPPPSM